MDSIYENLMAGMVEESLKIYGERLISLAVFGSVGRGTPSPDSDLDILVIAEPLPHGRMARVEEFLAVERAQESLLATARNRGFNTRISPVFKTPAEVARGSLLFLDMIDDARILFDRNDFFRRSLDAFRARLDRLGARRIWRGSSWFWDLKPDYKPGEIFEI